MNILKTANMLKQMNITHTTLTEEEIEAHKRAWILHFVPQEKWQKADACYCLPKKDGYSDYLWHAFSFKLIDALYGDEARSALCHAHIGEVILLSNWEDAGFSIPDGSALTTQILDGIADAVLTSADFKWTYAKTHESDLGPYFFGLD
jgi:hypothetical protein